MFYLVPLADIIMKQNNIHLFYANDYNSTTGSNNFTGECINDHVRKNITIPSIYLIFYLTPFPY